MDVSGFCGTVVTDLLRTVFQREELSAEGGRGAPQSQIQPHHPDLRHLQRTGVLLHSHRIHEQWLSGPVAPRGSYKGEHCSSFYMVEVILIFVTCYCYADSFNTLQILSFHKFLLCGVFQCRFMVYAVIKKAKQMISH